MVAEEMLAVRGVRVETDKHDLRGSEEKREIDGLKSARRLRLSVVDAVARETLAVTRGREADIEFMGD